MQNIFKHLREGGYSPVFATTIDKDGTNVLTTIFVTAENESVIIELRTVDKKTTACLIGIGENSQWFIPTLEKPPGVEQQAFIR